MKEQKFSQDRFYSLEQKAAPDDKNSEIQECLDVAVEAIYTQAKRQAILESRTVISDLEKIRVKSVPAYETVKLAILLFPSSYGIIAKERKVSKPAVFNQLQRLSKDYPWIKTIVDLMSQNS